MAVNSSEHLYSPEALVRQYTTLEKQAGKHYSITVDKVQAVPRTDNLEQFHDYERYVNGATKEVCLTIYQGKSHHAEEFVYTKTPDVAIPAPVFEAPKKKKKKKKSAFNGFGGLGEGQTLSGFLTEKIAEHKLGWDFDQLKTEHKELKEKHSNLEKSYTELEKELDAASGNNAKLGMLGTLAGPFFDSMAASSKNFRNTPLAGLLTTSEPAPVRQIDNGDVSFSPVNHAVEPGLAEFCGYITQTFTPAEFQAISGIIEAMGKDKTLIESVLGLVG